MSDFRDCPESQTRIAFNRNIISVNPFYLSEEVLCKYMPEPPKNGLTSIIISIEFQH